MMVWLNACPMCSTPVTFGGGSWMQNAGLPGAAPAAKRPDSSQRRYQRRSIAAGSKLFASTYPVFRCERARAIDAATASRTICVTVTVSSARTASSERPSTSVRVRARSSSISLSTSGPSRSSTASSSIRARASTVASSTPGPALAAASGSTTSVSTGSSPPPGSCRRSSAFTRFTSGLGSRGSPSLTARLPGKIVVAYLVAAAAVLAVARSGPFAVGALGRHHLEQPIEALEMRRALGREVEQHLAALGDLGARGDEHRRIGGERVVRGAVRHEADRGPGPQHAVDALRGLGLRRIHEHALVPCDRLAGQAAGDLHPVIRVEIEIYFRHFFPACRSPRRPSSGTGRPVEPFSRPLFHAVPAISRCAQRSLLAKRERKQAAVTLPAGRPPMFAMSAKLERNCSW